MKGLEFLSIPGVFFGKLHLSVNQASPTEDSLLG